MVKGPKEDTDPGVPHPNPTPAGGIPAQVQPGSQRAMKRVMGIDVPVTAPPRRTASPAPGMPTVVVPPDLFDATESDGDETFAGQTTPTLMADELRPPDLSRRPAAEQAQWAVLRAIEQHARSAHERGRQIELDVREHRASFAGHCAENKLERLEIKSELAEVKEKVSLSGRWMRVLSIAAGITGLCGAVAALLIALSQVAQSCASDVSVARGPMPAAQSARVDRGAMPR
jgi:hypothetical protein